MKTSALLISIAFAAQAFAVEPNAPLAAPESGPPTKVAIMGDSITGGVGTKKRGVEGYPAQLASMLGERYQLKAFGVSGSTLLRKGDKPYQDQGAFKSAIEFQPDAVVIMLGTNDTKPKNWAHKEEFIADYADLIGKVKAAPGNPRIWIAYAPFVPGKGNFGINDAGVQEEMPMIDKVAAQEKVGVIDVYGAVKDHPEYFPDRVHPNVAGATAIAKAMYKALTGREFEGEVPSLLEKPATDEKAGK